MITAQPIEILGFRFATPAEKYLLVLGIVVRCWPLAKNMVRSTVGRSWMAVRDMDVAAEVIGIRIMRKLLAFAVSSFYCGVAGRSTRSATLGTVGRGVQPRCVVSASLFMVIIGGVGSMLGFLGAAFHLLLPCFCRSSASARRGLPQFGRRPVRLRLMVFGALIIFFLIVEPHGLARLWQIGKNFGLWPFPHYGRRQSSIRRNHPESFGFAFRVLQGRNARRAACLLAMSA